MFSDVTAQLTRLADLSMAGRLGDLVSDYLDPLPVFLMSNRLILRTAHQAASLLGLVRAKLVSRGVVALRPKVSAIDLPRAGRFRVWVDWQEIAFPAAATRVSQAVCYFRETELGLRTEMVNYTHLSIPELNRQFAARALSA